MIKWIDRLMKIVDALSDEMPKDAWTAFWMAVLFALIAGFVFYDAGWRGAWPAGYLLAYAATALVILWFDNLRNDQLHRIPNLMAGIFLIVCGSDSLTGIGPAGLVSVPTWWVFWLLNAMSIPAGFIIVAHTLVHWRDTRAETSDDAKCDK